MHTRMLCLPNGERIRLNDAVLRMFFEADNVEAASPATVSRLGVVYVPASALGSMGPVLSRLDCLLPHSTPPNIKEQVRQLFVFFSGLACSVC
jgi:hypothetical protein